MIIWKIVSAKWNSNYKMRDKRLLRSASGITECDRLLLQSVSGITKCDTYYKVRRNNLGTINNRKRLNFETAFTCKVKNLLRLSLYQIIQMMTINVTSLFPH